MSEGYGRITRGGKKMFAHRAMYEQEIGQIPDGLELDHLCRNRLCVRPSHLEPVTRARNLRRGKNTKLTEEQVAEIRVDLRPFDVIAVDYGVHSSHISRIRSGKVWKPSP